MLGPCIQNSLLLKKRSMLLIIFCLLFTCIRANQWNISTVQITLWFFCLYFFVYIVLFLFLFLFWFQAKLWKWFKTRSVRNHSKKIKKWSQSQCTLHVAHFHPNATPILVDCNQICNTPTTWNTTTMTSTHDGLWYEGHTCVHTEGTQHVHVPEGTYFSTSFGRMENWSRAWDDVSSRLPSNRYT